MADICNRVQGDVQILTIHGTEDATIPVEDARCFAERLQGQRLLEIQGANHDYTSKEHSEQLIEAAVRFLVSGKS